MALTNEQFSSFRRDGFLNIGKVLSESILAELDAELERVISTGPDGFDDSDPKPVLYRNMSGDGNAERPNWQIVNIWEASTAFERLIYEPAVVEAISQLTGFGDLQVWHDQVQYKPSAYGGATTWHQDAPLWPSIEPMTPVSAWIPFDDATEENGCMWMVPGSHHWGNQIDYLITQAALQSLEEFANLGRDFPTPQTGPIREIRAVPRPVRRGEVHFHHSLSWHGSPQNSSPRRRRALAVHYMTSEARYTGQDHVMRQFIQVPVGASMLAAGPHFPVVCREGRPVSPLAPRRHSAAG